MGQFFLVIKSVYELLNSSDLETVSVTVCLHRSGLSGACVFSSFLWELSSALESEVEKLQRSSSYLGSVASKQLKIHKLILSFGQQIIHFKQWDIATQCTINNTYPHKQTLFYSVHLCT